MAELAKRAKEGWYRFRRRHPALRKAISLTKQVPRLVRRWGLTGELGYGVLANSIPKSGTHLLTQILEPLPGLRNYDSFIASIPPVRYRRRTRQSIHRRIGWIADGELASAHLLYDRSHHRHLQQTGVVVFFIYRDPRDIVISEAHYLAHMNRWHRAHRYFAALPDHAERIMTSIRGIPADEVDFEFPDIARRLEPYLGWLEARDVLALRFEDLVGEGREDCVGAIVRFFEDQAGVRVDEAALREKILANVDPRRSRTFRSGRSGGWQDVLNDDHREAFKAVAGDLLTRLGYEKNGAW